VTGRLVAPVDRAREELGAAQALLESGFPSQAVSRAYCAGLQAAQATLHSLGERPAAEAAVLTAFEREVAGSGGVEQEASRTLRMLFDSRNDVDFALVEAPDEEARRAIDAARSLVEASVRWLARRPEKG
jgi:uncharacterized protein (UPF0332 family)